MLTEVWVCGCSLAEIAGSNPGGGMDFCLLWVLHVVRQRSLRQAEHLSRGVLLSVVCLRQGLHEATCTILTSEFSHQLVSKQGVHYYYYYYYFCSITVLVV